MKINHIIYFNPKQAVLPMLIQDYLDVKGNKYGRQEEVCQCEDCSAVRTQNSVKRQIKTISFGAIANLQRCTRK